MELILLLWMTLLVMVSKRSFCSSMIVIDSWLGSSVAEVAVQKSVEDVLEIEFTVFDDSEEYFLLLVDEEGVRMCEGTITHSVSKVSCRTIDQHSLRKGDNLFFLTIYSMTKRRVAAQRTVHYHHEPPTDSLAESNDVLPTALFWKSAREALTSTIQPAVHRLLVSPVVIRLRSTFVSSLSRLKSLGNRSLRIGRITDAAVSTIANTTTVVVHKNAWHRSATHQWISDCLQRTQHIRQQLSLVMHEFRGWSVIATVMMANALSNWRTLRWDRDKQVISLFLSIAVCCWSLLAIFMRGKRITNDPLTSVSESAGGPPPPPQERLPAMPAAQRLPMISTVVESIANNCVTRMRPILERGLASVHHCLQRLPTHSQHLACGLSEKCSSAWADSQGHCNRWASETAFHANRIAQQVTHATRSGRHWIQRQATSLRLEWQAHARPWCAAALSQFQSQANTLLPRP